MPVSVYRAVLDISLDRAKIDRLRRRSGALEQYIRKMAAALRDSPGVRHIDACVFRAWRSFPEPSGKAPWEPHGVLIHVESTSRRDLDEKIAVIFNKARRFDQGMIIRDCIDIW